MIAIAKTEIKSGALLSFDQFEKNSWIDLISPLDREIEAVSAFTSIPEEMIKAALDEEESAHIDYDKDNDFRLVIIDVPVIEEEEDLFVYSTIPLGIITGKGFIVTVCLKETSIISDFKSQRVKGFSTTNIPNFLLKIIYRNSIKFLSYLKQIDKTSHRIQAELHKSLKNKEIIELLELENSLVYFSTALKANQSIIEKMSRFEDIKNSPELLDILDDIIIENRQAIETTGIYRDVLSGTMDAFASIINNNVNIIMKLLTIITIVISIPNLICSFMGMNIPLPMQNSPSAVLYVIIGTVILTLVTALILIKKTSRIK